MPVRPLSNTHSIGRLERRGTPGVRVRVRARVRVRVRVRDRVSIKVGARDGRTVDEELVVGDARADVLDTIAPATRVDLVRLRVRVRARVRVRVDSGYGK